MIQAKDLRLGNLVMFNGEVDSIIEIGQANNGYCEIEGYFNFDSGTINPIPLTPEWLERCGFERIQSNVPDLMRMPSFDGYRRLRWDYEGFSIETVGSGWIWYLHHIKYLHQLQNLYFALTGSDLTIIV